MDRLFSVGFRSEVGAQTGGERGNVRHQRRVAAHRVLGKALRDHVVGQRFKRVPVAIGVQKKIGLRCRPI